MPKLSTCDDELRASFEAHRSALHLADTDSTALWTALIQ